MSEVETLLSVDGGKIPPGTVAFFLADADGTVARTHWALSVTAGVAAAAASGAGAGRFLIALLLLAAAGLAVLAWPTLPEEEDEKAVPGKRQVMVVTTGGFIVRDEWGLRSWRFQDLAGVFTGDYGGRPHLVLVERNGTRHAINHLKFQGATRLHEVLDGRLRSRHG